MNVFEILFAAGLVIVLWLLSAYIRHKSQLWIKRKKRKSGNCSRNFERGTGKERRRTVRQRILRKERH